MDGDGLQIFRAAVSILNNKVSYEMSQSTNVTNNNNFIPVSRGTLSLGAVCTSLDAHWFETSLSTRYQGL
jgi:hypothetical protein